MFELNLGHLGVFLLTKLKGLVKPRSIYLNPRKVGFFLRLDSTANLATSRWAI